MYGISEYQYLYTYLHLVYKSSGKHKFPSSATSTPLVKITTPLGPLWLGGRSPWMIPVFPYKHVAWRQVKGPKFTSQPVSMDELWCNIQNFVNTTHLPQIGDTFRFRHVSITSRTLCPVKHSSWPYVHFAKKNKPHLHENPSQVDFLWKNDVFNYFPPPFINQHRKPPQSFHCFLASRHRGLAKSSSVLDRHRWPPWPWPDLGLGWR